MSVYDDELVKDLVLNELNKCVKVIKNPEPYLNLIEQKFGFNGSKIDWLQTKQHYSEELNNESLLTNASLFITELKEKYLNNNVRVMYIGDSLTECILQEKSTEECKRKYTSLPAFKLLFIYDAKERL